MIERLTRNAARNIFFGTVVLYIHALLGRVREQIPSGAPHVAASGPAA